MKKILLFLVLICYLGKGQEFIKSKQKPLIDNFVSLAKLQKKQLEVLKLPRNFEKNEEREERKNSKIKNSTQNFRIFTNTNLNSPSVSPQIAFLGSDRTLNPQDPMGAVGHDYVLTSDNALIRIHNKTGSTLATVGTYGTGGFWTGLITDGGFPADPWALYDPYSKRWILLAVLFRGSGGGAPIDLLIAVSQTSNPLGNWNKYKILEKGGHVMNIGFNNKWIATSNGIIFDKNLLYNGGALTYTDFTSSSLRGRVATTLDSTENDLYIVNPNQYINGVGTAIAINKISGNLATPTLSYVNYIPPTTMPPGSGYPNLIIQNGSLWMAYGTSCGTWANYCQNVVWGQIGLNPFSVLQVGQINNAGFSYTNAALAVNENNDVMIGYSIAGTGTYQSAAYSFRYGTDPINQMRDTYIYQTGVSGCSPYRWGDYAITCTDPDGYSLWTLQQAATLATPSPNFTSCDKSFWAKIDLNPPCTNLSILTPIVSGTVKFEAAKKIEANNLIYSGANATYDAGKYILLNPNFEARSGSVFKAQIDGCGNN